MRAALPSPAAELAVVINIYMRTLSELLAFVTVAPFPDQGNGGYSLVRMEGGTSYSVRPCPEMSSRSCWSVRHVVLLGWRECPLGRGVLAACFASNFASLMFLFLHLKLKLGCILCILPALLLFALLPCRAVSE